ncbi:MAG: flagellar biosynthesis protein FlhB [Phycisphaerales bacterium]|nr:flagellar biosynthesis protein FlhB [Phycisphaerales bacterium]
MAEDMGERTELPTARKRSEAANKGQIAKSVDLTGAVLLIGAAAMLGALGASIFRAMWRLTGHMLSPSVIASDVAGGRVSTDLQLALWETLRMIGPFVLAMMVLGYVAGVLQVGFMVSDKILNPDWSRLNPFAGLGRLFSRRTLVKTVVDVLKMSLVFGIAIVAIRSEWEGIVALAALDIAAAFMAIVWMVVRLAMWILAVMLLVGVVDYAYQRWQTTEDLRMTKQEVKDEMRSTDGDPEVKSRRLRMARQIAMQRLQRDVPKADVIVTNPTHFSVALAYEEKTMRAPRVVAKGADYLALKIRYIAAAHGVPIVERPPLARALYGQAEVGREISPEHYEAVAEVLAYVYRLEGRLAAS